MSAEKVAGLVEALEKLLSEARLRGGALSDGEKLGCAAIAAMQAAGTRPSAADAADPTSEAARIVAENYQAWGWGPLEEAEGLAEHCLALAACEAGYRAALASRPSASPSVVERECGECRQPLGSERNCPSCQMHEKIKDMARPPSDP